MDVITLSMIVAILWGIAPIIHKHVLKNTDPKVIVITGGLVYFACMIVFGWYFYEDVKDGISKMTWKTFAWITIATVFTAFLTLIMAYLILKEKVTWKSLLGVVLIVCGALILAFNQNVEEMVDMR